MCARARGMHTRVMLTCAEIIAAVFARTLRVIQRGHLYRVSSVILWSINDFQRRVGSFLASFTLASNWILNETQSCGINCYTSWLTMETFEFYRGIYLGRG